MNTTMTISTMTTSAVPTSAVPTGRERIHPDARVRETGAWTSVAPRPFATFAGGAAVDASLRPGAGSGSHGATSYVLTTPSTTSGPIPAASRTTASST